MIVRKSMTAKDNMDKVSFPDSEVFMKVSVSNLITVSPDNIGYRLHIVTFLINMALYPNRKDMTTPPIKTPGLLLVTTMIGRTAIYVEVDIPNICKRPVNKIAMLSPEIPDSNPTTSVTA